MVAAPFYYRTTQAEVIDHFRRIHEAVGLPIMAYDIPVTVTSLESAAGGPGGPPLPEGTIVLRNEDGTRGFIGAAPPRGTGVHRYHFVVHALDVPSLDLDPDAAAAVLGARCFFHGLARGILTPTASRD